MYGATNPTFTYLIAGFVNSDTSAVVSGGASLATAATMSSPVGTYPITFTAEGLTASNYGFNYISGSLTVFNTSSPLVLWLSPWSAAAGGAGFTLTVGGANFTPASLVLFNGAVRTTTYVSGTQLTATILTSDVATAGTNLITVANPAPNAATSAAQPFVVVSATPLATINGSSISDAAGSSGNHTLTLTGTNFVSGSTVDWNGVILATTIDSPWTIAVTLPAADFGTDATVTVVNPAGTSAGFELP